MLAAFDEGVARLGQVIGGAIAGERGWRERVRAALLAVLEFLDDESDWARFLLLDPPAATVAVAERRQQALQGLAQGLAHETRSKTVDLDGKVPGPAGFSPSPQLTAELVVGGVFAAVRGQLLEHPQGPFAALAPSLMSFISTSYATIEAAPEPALPVRATYRTTRVLGVIAQQPHSNNREIADAAGLRDEGQTSKLLSRLERRGLIENVGLGAAYGEPNEWLLTGAGQGVLKAASRRSPTAAGRPRGRAVRHAA